MDKETTIDEKGLHKSSELFLRKIEEYKNNSKNRKNYKPKKICVFCKDVIYKGGNKDYFSRCMKCTKEQLKIKYKK